MKIEVALEPSASTKARGDLLETLAAKLLEAQSFSVTQEIRQTAVELDLLCKHDVSGKEIYVECKAYRDKAIDANVLKNLAGTLFFKDYHEAWLISTSEYGKEAKGFIEEWKQKPKEQAAKLSFYDTEKVVKSLISAGVITAPPKEKAEAYLGSANLVGEWVLLITPYGDFWAAASLSGGIPVGVICFYATDGEQVAEAKLLKNISLTDTSLSKLQFSVPKVKPPTKAVPIDAPDVVDVVEVQIGEEWSDYRPARPRDFVGRTKDIKLLFDFFKRVRTKQTNTRIFALTGDSGMGKSSLVAKLASKAGNIQNKNRYFIYPVDMRAATSDSYIYSALLKTLKMAQQRGIGDPYAELTISDVSNPLNSASIRSYLASVESSHQLIILIFDQFEELYSKVELLELFNKAKALLLGTAAQKTNFCVGFAWKSDSTTHGEHPAYFFWHQLADYRLTVRLSPFTESESNSAINIFEKELNQKLHNDLRHNLIVSSQGYPWLLKKLCIHIYGKVKAGVNQSELLENKLDVASLFDSDLQELSQAERICLNFIAQRAPADWFEIIEMSPEMLRSLINRRLVTRSGDRLNIYWDIFREYLLTQKVPEIPLRYLPSTDFTSVYKVARNLRHEEPKSVTDLVELSRLSEGTVQNIGSDICMFGVATREGGCYALSKELAESSEVVLLRAIREKFKKHAFAMALKANALGTRISLNEAISLLKNLYPNSSYAEKTWHAYTVRMCRWLTLCGLLIQSQNGWVYRDQGDVVTERLRSARRRRGGGIFTAPASPGLALEVLTYLTQVGSMPKTGKKPKGYRNALSVLSRLDLVEINGDNYVPNAGKVIRFSSCEEAIWVSANSEAALIDTVKLLTGNSALTGRDVGEYLNTKYDLQWTDASKVRNGGAIRQWAYWIQEGKHTSSIPRCPGRV